MILENIDIDMVILENIDIDKISNRFKYGISNRAIYQISTTARVCRGFAKDVAIIHSNCYLNLLWGEGVLLNMYQQALSSAS